MTTDGGAEARLLGEARAFAASFRERFAAELAEVTVAFPRQNVDELLAADYLLLPVPERDGGAGVSLAT